MVAKIKSGKSIRGILMYNEQKVAEGKALCIGASRYGMEPEDLNFFHKLHRFEKLMEKNSAVSTNALHISLNFDTSEKFSKERLNELAAVYMQKIGFGDQPYLVYQHEDAAHPHIHIATTNIKEDGSRIDIHNIGRNQSETARKEIEIEYGLVQAESRKQKEAFNQIIGLKPEQLVYGKSETKRAMTNIVSAVMQTYKFSSLAEYNAALRDFGVTASRGGETTRMFKGNGLVYLAIDQQGKYLGASVKASAIYGSPTLAKLEKKFEQNKALKLRYKAALKLSIDKAVNSKPNDLQALGKALKPDGISVLYRTNKDGQVYGVTFTDHKHRVVMNGSELGKAYSIKGIQERLKITGLQIKETPKQKTTPIRPAGHKAAQKFSPALAQSNAHPKENLLEALLKPGNEFSQVPIGLKKKSKKRKRMRIS
ncbi:Relaxase/Mobilisation nuclease domain-containing protein [Mucilaginibacter pineti]|uniref:Relaxase/Mobilisation nuclease domain-containing protein n=1 Tax=Mucilaginibacter pineti TaxID=1391627 RepID=A0A1G7ESE3_9SPHI|nr:relaxase/mobilization nuclease domain-containing protein [Mucilaginibacter pineti]SDE66583.1 Relaxase/Mobilisation nuclease domain-containing protein [Mucilaginibacter pineti]